MNVQTFKVLNGDEIVADVSHVGNDFAQIMHPRIFQQVIDPESQKPAGVLLPWPALAAKNQMIRIPITSFLTMPADAHEELERRYTANVTGMTLPPVQPKIVLQG